MANQIHPDEVQFLAELQRYGIGVVLRKMMANVMNMLD
jgi:hypothetical protein